MSDVDLVGLLAEHGLRPKSFAAGHTEKIMCVRCNGGRTRELSLSLKIDPDGDGAVWQCHRGTCGWTGSEKIHRPDNGRRPLPKSLDVPAQAPPDHAPAAQTKPEALYRFFGARGISQETVDAFGCYITRHWFPGGEAEQNAIVFPYLFNGRVVNRKYRSPQKMFIQEKNPLPTLFNVDEIGSPDIVIWVEGEADVMAMFEAGYPQTVTLANGAPAELRAEDDPRRQDDKRFAALATHSEVLSNVRKFVLAGDVDGPGEVLREELARRLGRHRCWLVTWPDGCKDACDVLKAHGVAAIQSAVETAQPYPIEGLQRVDAGTLVAMRHNRPPVTLTTGAAATDRELHFPAEGRLIIVTGIPSAGKSTWMRHVGVHLMAEHNRRFVIFSPEMQPWEQFAAMYAETLVGKKFWPAAGYPSMSDAEISYAEAWLRDRMVMLVSDSEEVSPTVDWILEMARLAVLRDGITDLQIDPWNEVDHSRGNLTEAEYIGRSLQRLKAFALRHGVNVWIVVHPVKLQPPKAGGQIEAPGLYDISGGAMWNNKADLGIVIHTPEETTQIIVRKARFTRWGKRNGTASLAFNTAMCRYVSVNLEDELDDRDAFKRRFPLGSELV